MSFFRLPEDPLDDDPVEDVDVDFLKMCQDFLPLLSAVVLDRVLPLVTLLAGELLSPLLDMLFEAWCRPFDP